MHFNWSVPDSDVLRLNDFVKLHHNPFVARRISRNVNRQDVRVDKDAILRQMIMCLLTTQQRSGPNSSVAIFLRKIPFPLTESAISGQQDIETFVRQTLKGNGLNRFIDKIPKSFLYNFGILQTTGWTLLDALLVELNEDASIETERKMADHLHDTFSGFGPKQSRNFLQALGLTKYEIPIDSRITTWLNNFGFPITLSSSALQDRGYYHLVSDGIQALCSRAEIYPCVLDAAIFASFDKGQWTEENAID